MNHVHKQKTNVINVSMDIIQLEVNVYEAVEGAVITGHEILDNGVRVVTYSNGVQIYLNYSSAAQTVDGVSIDTMSYKVVGANE